MSALPTSQQLFAFLDETHRRIDAQVQRLAQLVDTLSERDWTAAERQDAQQLCDFFETEARQHHLDEERHIFPELLTSADASVVQATHRLTQDHGWLEENWIEIYPHLQALSQSSGSYDEAELRHAVDVFKALYEEHMQLEESLAYPQARQMAHRLDVLGAGREMAQRRFKAERLAQAV